ncbi:hypothetical protein K492DRAFT_237638 [Lichtheimia hyalospora FSU 10163]|nr:hypothetical protein K492DRAFT_237638 [Lichtheimia hyalospora FSU 10163]
MTREVQRNKSFQSSSPEEEPSWSPLASSPPTPPRANRIRPCTHYQRPTLSFSERLRRARESSPIIQTSSVSISNDQDDDDDDNSFIFNADPIFDTNLSLPPLRLESPSPPPSPSPSSSHSISNDNQQKPVRHSGRDKPSSWMDKEQQRNRSSRGKKKKKEKQPLSTKRSSSSTTPTKPSKGAKSISAPSSSITTAATTTTTTITKRKQITLSTTIIPTATNNDTWADKSRLRPRTTSSSSFVKHRQSSHNETNHKPRTIKAGHC